MRPRPGGSDADCQRRTGRGHRQQPVGRGQRFAVGLGSAITTGDLRVGGVLAHNCPAFNKASIRVRQRENGFSGTNYFRQIAQGQVFINGAWRNRGSQAVQRSTQFANNGQNFIYDGPNWVFTWNNRYAFSHRILVRLQWWNNAGTPNFFGDDYVVANGAVFNRCT